MLRCTALHFAYTPSRPILRGLDIDFPHATLTAILGPNGCGKSTLLRLLLGTLTPTQGRATLDNVSTTSIPPRTRAARIALLAQRSELSEPLTLRQYVRLGRFARSQDHAACDAAIARVDLADRIDDPVPTLSAGQQQRAALARVLAQLHAPTASPQFVLADEPASSQDPAHTLFTLRTLRQLTTSGAGVIVVLHDPALALAFADRVALLDSAGSLIAQGDAKSTLTPAYLNKLFAVRYHAIAPEPDCPSLVLDPRSPTR